MKHVILIILVSMMVPLTWGQNNLVGLHSYYKDQLFANKGQQPIMTGSFYPISEKQYDLIGLINDSSKRYYTLTDILYHKHLVEIHSEDVYLTMSPVVEASFGKDFSDTSDRNLFQNTRGFIVEGDFFENFSFATAFFENQSRFTQYESSYYRTLGEKYIANDSAYYTQNAVFPGSGRTKPFKEDGFDYASAWGYFVYNPWKNVQLMAGNNPQFIGDGHRSLLLSDNSFHAPYFRIVYDFHPNWQFNFHRSRLLNLIRRPFGSSAESYYEPKGYSINYLTYHTNSFSASLFEGNIWNRGDSIQSHFSNPLYYSPIPLLSPLLLDNNILSSFVGLNLSWQAHKDHRLYAQYVTDFPKIENSAFQLGYRGYRFFNQPDLMLQVEYNYVPAGMYENQNPRLSYSHYNLPLAHPKGDGFQEILLRIAYEKSYWYSELSANYYQLNGYSPNAHLAIYDPLPRENGSIFRSNLEVGYRFNRKMNLSVFTNWIYRLEQGSNKGVTSAVQVGFKTGIVNRYSDF